MTIRISADSNYAIYLNGNFAASEQYPDFPHYKVYDEIDITKFCKKGKNRIAIVVWYYGNELQMTYYPGKAALRFELTCDGNLISFSNSETLSRKSLCFEVFGGLYDPVFQQKEVSVCPKKFDLTAT